ncbi:bifunctional adenosylcobinamide kinase/adenosylcobinamide-phosphate guanylyltransferase [Bacillus massilinigeriensis]|uniref:bifunctional adenosylcobinamide kinase/adenosylcobinamide-phosphate guanylyltransferase n=1 Tax=Bacillus mediterraneensis TaxID=1805474 RepID=UPI0008F9019F|nr:bifunctional adenosylcobinamide kinase/adenosylcobinamide-phosphate guanylyltransferase [Bacillus mediterraneensis]
MVESNNLILVTGGVRSGKSSFAEKIATRHALQLEESRLHYIAPGKRTDLEMERRIEHHQETRRKSGFHWRTWEEYRLDRLQYSFTEKDIVLLDCLTTLVNEAFFQQEKNWDDAEFQKELIARVANSIKNLSSKVGGLVIVSNDIFHEPVLDNRLVLQYTRTLGSLHQQLARIAQQVYFVEFGMPLFLKGEEVE